MNMKQFDSCQRHWEQPPEDERFNGTFDDYVGRPLDFLRWIPRSITTLDDLIEYVVDEGDEIDYQGQEDFTVFTDHLLRAVGMEPDGRTEDPDEARQVAELILRASLFFRG